MMNEFQQTLEQVNNMQQTENGATGYSKSGKNLVDLNFTVPSNHNNVSLENIQKFIQSLNEDLVHTVKWMFYLRDVREGLGERDSFVNLYMTLYSNNQEAALKVLPLIPVYGRWKDVIDILDRSADDGNLSGTIYALLEAQLMEDCQNMADGKSISLLAKWMPSINSTKKARKLAMRICRNLSLLFVEYRKMLAAMRRYIDVTEVKTCGGNWKEIDYNKVSSNANARYLKAFIKHDEARRRKYLEDLTRPVTGAVMHASNLYPHEVYAKYNAEGYRGYEYSDVNADPGIEALWANLKKIQTTGNTMCVCDGSGSMEKRIAGSNVMAIDVSRALSIFFSEKCEGEFKDKVIEFSEAPRYIDLSGCKTLAEKYNVMNTFDDCSNTNLERVFDLLLKTAVDHHLPQDELPSRILIVSDMEFDQGCEFSTTGWTGSERMPYDQVMARYKTLFQSIKMRWDAVGYKMPEVVFWNVNSRTNTIPVTANEAGVKLVSGFSVNNVKMILANELDPWTALKSVLDTERYDAIEEVLA